MNAVSKLVLGLLALSTVSVAVAASSLTEKQTSPAPMGICDGYAPSEAPPGC